MVYLLMIIVTFSMWVTSAFLNLTKFMLIHECDLSKKDRKSSRSFLAQKLNHIQWLFLFF